MKAHICQVGAVVLSASFCLGSSTYHMGNSLTNDMLNGRFHAMVESRTGPHEYGYHIRNSGFLAHFANEPDDVSMSSPQPYGTYQNALVNYAWDVVTFQPYYGWSNGSTLQSDIGSIEYFVNLARSNPENSDTRFYIYAAWPNIDFAAVEPLNYQNQWLRESSGEMTQLTMLARDYFLDLHAELQEAGLDLLMIPAGQVIYSLDQKMRSGELSGFETIHSLYRDNYHLNDLGKHVAACTVFATIYGTSPLGLAYTGAVPVSPEVLASMQQTVWDVIVANQEYTGVPEPGCAMAIASMPLILLGRRRHH